MSRFEVLSPTLVEKLYTYNDLANRLLQAVWDNHTNPGFEIFKSDIYYIEQDPITLKHLKVAAKMLNRPLVFEKAPTVQEIIPAMFDVNQAGTRYMITYYPETLYDSNVEMRVVFSDSGIPLYLGVNIIDEYREESKQQGYNIPEGADWYLVELPSPLIKGGDKWQSPYAMFTRPGNLTCIRAKPVSEGNFKTIISEQHYWDV